jgi:hypothetical protein
MRIGSLARRLGIPPSDILGFLAVNNIEAESGANSRLAEDTLLRVVKHFAPEKVSEIFQAPDEVVEVVQEQVEEQVVQPVIEEPATVAEETPVEEEAPEVPLEVIRVSKVELQGLKVLGKIDLPQPKKKLEDTDPKPEGEEQPVQQQQPAARSPRKEFQKRSDRRDREWKNPLEQKRLQEARDAEQKKRDRAEQEKERRTNNYYK